MNVAHIINQSSEDEWPALVHKWLVNKELHPAVCEMNRMLDDPNQRDDAIRALQRIGLWQSH